MINALLVATTANLEELKVEDYFPLESGIIRFYDEEMTFQGRNSKFSFTETVQGKTDLKRVESYIDLTEPDENLQKKERIVGESAFQVQVNFPGGKPELTFYQYNGRNVQIASVQPGVLLDQPYPILAVGRNPEIWLFSGFIPVMGAPAQAVIEGESRPTKDYKFLGKTYPAIQVTTKYVINLEVGEPATTSQKSIYAKGIGLVEFEETGKIGKDVTKRKRKLTRIHIPD